MRRPRPILLFAFTAILAGQLATPTAMAGELSLAQAVALAIAQDPWQSGSRHTEQALADEAVAAGTLPDPKLSLSAGNLPIDTFDLRQEPMTQLSVGISQTFPRGSSRAIARAQKQLLAAREPMRRLDRQAKVRASVTGLWLEAFQAQESIRLIRADYALFEQLVDAARSNYTTAMAQTRQQDLIRAQLELTRLDHRLTQLRQQQEAAQRRLSEWIGPRANDSVVDALPVIRPAAPTLLEAAKPPSEQAWYLRLRRHPAVLALDRKIAAESKDVDLARQAYKPEWTLSASYGYRGEDPSGRGRSDLLSAGLSVDLPLFTAKKQDRQLSAAVQRREAIETDKLLLIRQLMARLETKRSEIARLSDRRDLYRDRLLPQLRAQAEASLSAYDADAGDFPEAVRARIDLLDARIEALGIDVQRLRAIVQANYLLTQADPSQGMAADGF